MTEQASNRAIWSLVCGILGFTACPIIGSVLAMVLGWDEPSTIGRAGKILGIAGLVITVLGVLVWIVFFGLLAGGAAIANH